MPMASLFEDISQIRMGQEARAKICLEKIIKETAIEFCRDEIRL